MIPPIQTIVPVMSRQTTWGHFYLGGQYSGEGIKHEQSQHYSCFRSGWTITLINLHKTPPEFTCLCWVFSDSMTVSCKAPGQEKRNSSSMASWLKWAMSTLGGSILSWANHTDGRQTTVQAARIVRSQFETLKIRPFECMKPEITILYRRLWLKKHILFVAKTLKNKDPAIARWFATRVTGLFQAYPSMTGWTPTKT